MHTPMGVLFALTLIPCASPTSPPPTGPNATITGTVVERLDGTPLLLLAGTGSTRCTPTGKHCMGDKCE